MAGPVKLSKSRIFDPFNKKREFSTVISWFEYRVRPGPGWNRSHNKVHSRLLNWAKNQPYVFICTAVVNLAKFNLLKKFAKGWRATHHSKALIETRKIQFYVPIRKMSLSQDIDESIWKSSFLSRRYLRPWPKLKLFTAIFFLFDPELTKNCKNNKLKIKFRTKSSIR